ncbi:MAG: hypothetical protein KGP14_03795 [Betaproteobacteria bacterium]|nr:hypothetical protein [Betaproteobacteria bacterium]
MALKPLDLGKQSNQGRYPHAGVAQLVNMYCESAGTEGRFQFPLYPVAGLTQWATHSGGAGIRAMLATATELLVVAGRTLSAFDASGDETVIGGIPSDGLVTMSQNRVGQVTIVCDGVYYVYQGGAVAPVNARLLPAPNSICCLDGYSVLTQYTGRFDLSGIDAATTFDGLTFATAESVPGPLLVGKTRGRDLVLFGPNKVEVWADTGGADFPFSRRTAMTIGCLNAASVTPAALLASGQALTDTIIWPATDSQGNYTTVAMLMGDQAVSISTPYVDRLIATETNQAGITGTAWTERGHGFCMLSGTNWSVVYDTKTGLWHDRQSNGGRSIIGKTLAFGGQIIAGDATQGILYVLAPDAHDENGAPLVCTVQTPPVAGFPARLEVNEIYIDTIPGQGLLSGGIQNTNPQIMLQWTADGQTWSTERWQPMGRAGNTTRRVKWNRLGTSKQEGRSYRFRMSADVARGFMGAFIDTDVVAP